ncbi:MAG: DUF1211 domain-containing protein [Thermoplasmata archaeon]|nr:DUF1211 domain-containing protein [Thermoplasmata archaeon]
MSISARLEDDEVGLRKTRLEALSDGVFGVALTILALDLIIPHSTSTGGSNTFTWNDILNLRTTLFVVLLGFIVVGSFWLGNHLILHYIHHTDRYFIWISLLYLFAIVILPYSTLLVADFSTQVPAIVFFGVDQLAAGLLGVAMWAYAGRFELFRPSTDQHTRSYLLRRLMIGPLLTAIGIGVALFISAFGGLVVFASIIILYLIPSHLDEHLRSPGHAIRRGPGM